MKESNIHISAEEFRRMKFGGVTERLKAPASKADKPETVSRVPIPPPPNPIANIANAADFDPPKKSKYWAVRTEYNGRNYASKLEAENAQYLDFICQDDFTFFKNGLEYISLAWCPQIPFKLPGNIVYRLDFGLIFICVINKTYPMFRFFEIKCWDKKNGIYRMTQSARDKIKQVEAIYHIEIEITNDIKKLF